VSDEVLKAYGDVPETAVVQAKIAELKKAMKIHNRLLSLAKERDELRGVPAAAAAETQTDASEAPATV